MNEEFLMTNAKTQKVVALIATAGLTATVAQSGLMSQLFQVLDMAFVPPAQAQSIRWRGEQQPVPAQFLLKEFEADRLVIKGGRALLLSDTGKQPAPDGFYQLPDGRRIAVEEGRVQDCSAITNPLGHDCGGGWELVCDPDPEICNPRPQETLLPAVPQTPKVRDTYEQIRNQRTLPSDRDRVGPQEPQLRQPDW